MKRSSRARQATIEFIDDNLKEAVVKCPNNLSVEDCEAILIGSVDGLNGDRVLPFPEKLCAVHTGVIYDAQMKSLKLDHGL